MITSSREVSASNGYSYQIIDNSMQTMLTCIKELNITMLAVSENSLTKNFKNFMVPFYVWFFTASRLQSH